MKTFRNLFLFFLCCFTVFVSAQNNADWVFRHGKVYTVDKNNPWAEAVAVKDSVIVFVGTDVQCKKWIGKNTRVVDLNGRMLLPGFIDGHNHFVSGMSTKRGVRLVGSKNKQELLRRISDYVKANPQKNTYMGSGWEFPMFGASGATRQELDAICSDKPMMFFNEDTHHAWFNTKAMNMGGITKETPDPVPGSSYYKREPDGTPSGIAIEPEAWQQSMAIATGILGGREMLKESADEVFPLLPKLGITAYHEMGIWAPDFPQGYLGYELLLDMERERKLPCRVFGVYGIRNAKASPEEHVQALKEWSKRYHSNLVRVTGLKIWVDGTFLANTGLQIEPYANKPESRGESGWTTDVLARWIELAYTAGFDVNIHCDGDMATRRSLDAVELVSKKLGPSERITTLHHVPTIHPDDLHRFKALGVGANMTPVWLVDYKGQYQEAMKIFGKEKVAKEYGLLNQLIADGVNVSFGSDIPGTDIEEASPLLEIQTAVTGRVPGSKTTIVPPANRLPSLEQMIYGYTLAGARQIRMANKIGSIEVGKLADIIVLDKNIFTISSNKIKDVHVDITMMNGNITNNISKK